MSDEPEGQNPPGLDSEDEISAFGELAACENLSQAATWTARWATRASGADGLLVFVPHSLHPVFLCAGAFGEGTEKCLRRSAPREEGVVHELVRDRATIAIPRDEIETSPDPFVKSLPPSTATCLAVPLEDGDQLVGIAALLFRRPFDADRALDGLASLLVHANPALGRAIRADRKSAGMLQAIERLTNLFDLTKAFGSTIDLEELTQLIVKKAADFAGAEVASLWLLEGDAGEVTLAATAANENYDVSPVPAAVGAGVVGDVIAEQVSVRRSKLADDDPICVADPDFPVRSILALPFLEDEAATGALVVVNKRGRSQEFTLADEELLADLAKQAVRALRNARLFEAEKKVEELDALLAVSREITATLDLDKVMKTVVNASSALITFDRASIAILQRGTLKLGAVSGSDEVDRKDPSVKRTEELLEWVFHSGSDVAVTQQEDGTLLTDRPETEEKFRVFFAESERRCFSGWILSDEEGKLGVIGFESARPLVFDEGARDLVQILVNQATVAVRNAQLYQQVPLAGFWKPLLEKRKRLAAIPVSRRRQAAVWSAVALLVLVFVPWRVRIGGPARVLPALRTTVAAQVTGVVESVLKKEGDVVAPGDVLARLRDETYRAALEEARANLSIAEADVVRFRTDGDAAAMFQAAARRDELTGKIALATEHLDRTSIRAPAAGVIVTPRLPDRVGKLLAAGEEYCVVAGTSSVIVEVAVPEIDAALLATGQPLAIKIHAYPGRIFRGTVARVGAAVHEEGEERFVLAETRVENPDGTLLPGMLGKGKVTTDRRSLLSALARRPLRYFWLKLWPALP